ncbi:class I SAM-dependent methyltransferase [Candidatus Bathyarchaeota archaeon]|jgi:ubiquinone/menaquinone biosynthesis C-methylase UbiE|nr:class I SAM-dependent methyltransferase [Candidatus Bathyarchaeota archaeon]
MENFAWNGYIGKLSDFPELTSQWEIDMINEIKDQIPKGGIRKMLEVGCSNGRWIRWFCQEYGCEGYGIDNRAEGFKKKDVNFILGDAFKLPFTDNSFDIVFSKGFIEHFKKPQDFMLLKEHVRVLKNKGYLICEVPNLAVSLEYLYVKYFYDFKQGYKHYIKTHRQIMSYFKKLNLQIISSKFFGWFFERFNVPQLFNCSFTSQEYMVIGVLHNK